MQPVSNAAMQQRIYVERRLAGDSPTAALQYLQQTRGYLTAQQAERIEIQGERALGTARRANRQRLDEQLQYSAYANRECPDTVRAQVRLHWRMADGSMRQQDQWWNVANTESRRDLRTEAGNELEQRYPSADAPASLVSIEYLAVFC